MGGGRLHVAVTQTLGVKNCTECCYPGGTEALGREGDLGDRAGPVWGLL